MGEMIPVKTQAPRAGLPVLRTLVLAVCYIALIPAVSLMALLASAEYFPGATRAVLGPALSKIVPAASDDEALAAADQAVSNLTAAEDRLSKLEADIAGLAATVAQPKPSEPGQTAQGGQTGQASQPPVADEAQVKALIEPVRLESRGNDKLLAALSALTLARAELLSGNREVAQRELKMAQASLAGATNTPKGVTDALASASDSLTKGSTTAADWLSLAWHALAEAIVSGGTPGTP